MPAVQTEGRCLIWPGAAARREDDEARLRALSDRAGGCYAIAREDTAALDGLDDRSRVALSRIICEHNVLGLGECEVTPALIDRARASNPPTTRERLELALQAMRFFYPGLGDEFDPVSDILQAASSSLTRPEAAAVMRFAIDEGLLKANTSSGGALRGVEISFKGHRYLDDLAGTNRDSRSAFVAMWFDPSMDAVWREGIQPAIIGAGYDPVRLDEHEHANDVNDEIIAQIRRSRFLVADFTCPAGAEGALARGGVYFEAGFAQGLGIPVVWTCRKDCVELAHFDVRQFNFIDWETPEELRGRLASRISAVIGDGPGRQGAS